MRDLALELGIGKSSAAKYLRIAKDEERAAQAEARTIEAAKIMPTAQPEARPGARVWLGVPGTGLVDPHGHLLAAAEQLGRLRRRANSSIASEAVRAAREIERLEAAACVNAGLSPDGMATYETPISKGSYEAVGPNREYEVERVRRTIREDVLIFQESEEMADYLAQTWQPHPGVT